MSCKVNVHSPSFHRFKVCAFFHLIYQGVRHKTMSVFLYSSMNQRTNQLKEHHEKSHDPYIILIYLAICYRGNVMMHLSFTHILLVHLDSYFPVQY